MSKALAVRQTKLSILDMPGVDWSDGSLDIDRSKPLPFDAWRMLLLATQSMSRNNRWWVGDCYNYGESVYGEEQVSQALTSPLDAASKDDDEATKQLKAIIAQRNIDTTRNSAWVCRRFPQAARKYSSVLSFEHHYTVASLCYDRPDIALALLKDALAQEMKVAQFRKYVKAKIAGREQAASVEAARPVSATVGPAAVPSDATQAVNGVAPARLEVQDKRPDLVLAKHDCPACYCIVSTDEKKAIDRDRELLSEFRRERDNYRTYRRERLGLVEE